MRTSIGARGAARRARERGLIHRAGFIHRRGFEACGFEQVFYSVGVMTAGPLTAQAVHDVVRAELEVIDAAYARLRATCTDLAGNAFRIEVAERLETQARVNRGLSYRMFGEIAAPADGPDDPGLPAGVKVRDVLGVRLRLTASEVRRRFGWPPGSGLAAP